MKALDQFRNLECMRKSEMQSNLSGYFKPAFFYVPLLGKSYSGNVELHFLFGYDVKKG